MTDGENEVDDCDEVNQEDSEHNTMTQKDGYLLLLCVLLVVVALNYFANLVRVSKLDGISQFVMAYGGLRGAIAFSLASVLDRDQFHSRQLFITTTIVVVYFTNIVLVSDS